MKKPPKSIRHIINAFMEMRAQQPLEEIMVIELCEKADINKSTFYAYFNDVFDLSDQLENEVIQRILASIPSADLIFDSPEEFARILITAFQANSSLISKLFSGTRACQLPEKLERALMGMYFNAHPEKKKDQSAAITLTYRIYGTCYACLKNDLSDGKVTDIITKLSSK